MSRARSSTIAPDLLGIGMVLVGLSTSFVLGWFVDHSHPLDGIPWRDQTRYLRLANRIAEGSLPHPGELHSQIGFGLLGAFGHFLSPAHPFMPISLALLLGSGLFAYLAAREYLSIPGTLVFLLLLFYWDLSARSLNYASEVFAIPWNNQVVFFAMCFFFWLCAKKTGTPPSWKLAMLVGLVGGFAVLTREETVLFFAPLIATYLLVARARPGHWITCLAVAALAYLPQVLIRVIVLGSPLSTGRTSGDSYGDLISRYLSGARLLRNTALVIFHAPASADRVSVLQSSVWLWLAPLGLVAFLVSGRVSWSIKAWVAASVALVFFYLAGENVSPEKLRFHCIRYFSAGFVAANFSVAFLGSRTWSLIVQRLRPTAASPRLDEDRHVVVGDAT